jgi:hypothetical protein
MTAIHGDVRGFAEVEKERVATASYKLMAKKGRRIGLGAMGCMEPERSKMQAISVRFGFIFAATISQGVGHWRGH